MRNRPLRQLKQRERGFHFSFTIRAAAHKDSEVVTLCVTLTASAAVVSCLIRPRTLHHSSSIETFLSRNPHVSVYFALLPLPFSECVSPICALNSGSRFPLQSRGDLSDSQGSAAYISCQWLELCVFPHQSKACLRSWKAFNIFSPRQADPQAAFLHLLGKRDIF